MYKCHVILNQEGYNRRLFEVYMSRPIKSLNDTMLLLCNPIQSNVVYNMQELRWNYKTLITQFSDLSQFWLFNCRIPITLKKKSKKIIIFCHWNYRIIQFTIKYIFKLFLLCYSWSIFFKDPWSPTPNRIHLCFSLYIYYKIM